MDRSFAIAVSLLSKKICTSSIKLSRKFLKRDAGRGFVKNVRNTLCSRGVLDFQQLSLNHLPTKLQSHVGMFCASSARLITDRRNALPNVSEPISLKIGCR